MVEAWFVFFNVLNCLNPLNGFEQFLAVVRSSATEQMNLFQQRSGN
jgi:hypothetical protein